MGSIFLWPHPKLGHTILMNSIPLTLVSSPWGGCPHTLLSLPSLRECREGCSHVGSWILLSITMWLAWFPSFPTPGPIVIVCDEPLTPPSPSTLPLQYCPRWLKPMPTEVMLSGVLPYKTPPCAKVYVRCKSANAVNDDWGLWRMSHQTSSPLPITFKLHHGEQFGL